MMKKTMLIFVLLSVGLLSAQTKFTEFKIGIHNPAGAKSGFWGGLSFGRAVDNNIAVSTSIDIYRSSYTKETTIHKVEITPGVYENEKVVGLEQSTTLIPLFFNIQYQGPMSRFINLRITAGLGYEFLWNSFQNYNTKEDVTNFYSAFGWHAGAGIAYELSKASDVFAQITYHSGAPSRARGETEEGLPTHKEIDMSGLGLRLGIRIYNFGF